MDGRLDDKHQLTKFILGLVAEGVDVDDLDVCLARIGPVDLDLMAECVQELSWFFEGLEKERDAEAA